MRTVSNSQTLVLHFLEEAEKMIHLPSVSSPEYTNTHTPLTSALSTTFHQWEGSAQQDRGEIFWASHAQCMWTCNTSMTTHKHAHIQTCLVWLSCSKLFLQSTRHFVIPLFSFQRQHHGSMGGPQKIDQ